jgi:hypothetical protein
MGQGQSQLDIRERPLMAGSGRSGPARQGLLLHLHEMTANDPQQTFGTPDEPHPGIGPAWRRGQPRCLPA